MGKGMKINPEHAKIIYRAYLTQPKGYAKHLCFMYGYKLTTYYKIINNEGIVENNYYGKPRKWTPEMISTAVSYIETTNSQITLEELLDVMVQVNNFPRVSLSTLWNYLDGELVTLKASSFQNQMRNDINNKIKRQEYVQWFLQNQDRTYLFIDECGFNLNTLRRQARSKKGNRAVVTVAQNKGTNLSVCACVNKDLGLIFYDFKVGSMNSEDFMIFLAQLAEVVMPMNLQKVTLIFDNCRIHDEAEINQVCIYAGWEYEYLPPYSPMLNIIEEVFSLLKFAIKRQMAGPLFNDRLKIANLPFGQKTIARVKLLETALKNSITEIVPEKCMAYWNHMMAILSRCLNLQDV